MLTNGDTYAANGHVRQPCCRLTTGAETPRNYDMKNQKSKAKTARRNPGCLQRLVRPRPAWYILPKIPKGWTSHENRSARASD